MLGDCLELMDNIPDDSVDMILCDLPYGTTRNKWDVIISLDLLWKQYNRVCKANAAIVLTSSQPFTSILVCSNISQFKCEWIWKKNRGSNFASLKYQPFKEHESILVFSKGTCNYFPIKEARSESGKSRANYSFKDSTRSDNFNPIQARKERYDLDTELRNPSSVQVFNTEVGLHPTQKPVSLFEYLIKTYTQPYDTVLDNCAGSFTTAIACMNTSRNYICIEKEKEYFDIGQRRIYEANCIDL